jgi:hypothetical protein
MFAVSSHWPYRLGSRRHADPSKGNHYEKTRHGRRGQYLCGSEARHTHDGHHRLIIFIRSLHGLALFRFPCVSMRMVYMLGRGGGRVRYEKPDMPVSY